MPKIDAEMLIEIDTEVDILIDDFDLEMEKYHKKLFD